MKKLIIAYHAYMYGDHYWDMITEQFRLLSTSGLYAACDKLYIGLVDDPTKRPKDGFDRVSDYWSLGSSKQPDIKNNSKIEIVQYKENWEETQTMQWIRSYAAKNPDDYVLYFHTKGITRYTEATESWRRYMEYFAVENWKDCIDKLKEGYDCCGVRWHTGTFMGKFPHFSGGFWWANTNYIKTLNGTYLDCLKRSNDRFYREFWIGSNPKVNQYSFHDNGIDPYAVVYPRSLYEKQPPTLHVISTAFNRAIQLRMLIDGFLVQTSPRWVLHIIHDGIAPKDVKRVVLYYDDNRIDFVRTPKVNGHWGHPNRKKALHDLVGRDNDYVVITNEDNYYAPTFVATFLAKASPKVGMIVCDLLHSSMGYGYVTTVLKEGAIDMGCFAVKYSVAKAVEFNHQHFSADGAYAEDCANYCKKNKLDIVYLRYALFVHN
jgi:hypothetical protein